MLSENKDLTHTIIDLDISLKNSCINVEIDTGSIIDGIFKSDGRGTIIKTIRNILDKDEYKKESLIVDGSGAVALSLVPIDGNEVSINGLSQPHISGQSVICSEASHGDSVIVTYYHRVAGRDWFNEQCLAKQTDFPDWVGLSDKDYLSKRVWKTLLEMGLVSGVVV